MFHFSAHLTNRHQFVRNNAHINHALLNLTQINGTFSKNEKCYMTLDLIDIQMGQSSNDHESNSISTE